MASDSRNYRAFHIPNGPGAALQKPQYPGKLGPKVSGRISLPHVLKR